MKASGCLQVDLECLRPTCIRASAGSGKTYQLVNRYLQLTATAVPPAHILATTFTRAAAGQIRDRILHRLAEAAECDAKRQQLRQDLRVESLSRSQVIQMLLLLARNLSRMQIRTLDSLFASVVRAFAVELGVPLGAEVADENQERQLRAEAIHLMLDERKPQHLIDLLRMLTEGASQRAVSPTIDSVVSSLYEVFREADKRACECIPALRGLEEQELQEAIDVLRNLAVSPNKTWEKAHAKSVASAGIGDWKSFVSNGLPKAIIAGGTEFRHRPIDETVRRAYQPLIDHAASVLIGRKREQTLATRDLLQQYHEQLEGLKQRRLAITFGDLTAAMARAVELGAMDDIGFRLDAHLHHLLLDEFQDTSIGQWRALRSIAEELVSNTPPQRTFFCVGDAKQSIYGWRQAAPEILDELPHLLAGPDGSMTMVQMDLQKSYRSSQPVIDVVNTVFSHLHGNQALSNHGQAVELWSQGFKEHETARGEYPGYVELRAAPPLPNGKTPQRERTRLRLGAAADFVAQLHAQHPHLHIAVLTRTNKCEARMLYELGPSRRNVAATGRGGGPLIDAAPVNAILDLLHLADHPDDTIAAFNVANSPLGQVVELARFDCAEDRRRVARLVRDRLVDEGYGAVIADLVQQLSTAGACDARELRRLLQLVELATQFDVRRTLRAHDFIDLVEHTDVADAGGNGVTGGGWGAGGIEVMTVHQAKGAEFDVVVLPELDCRLIGKTPPVVFERGHGEDETGPVTRISRYIDEDTLTLLQRRPDSQHLQAMHERHRRRTVRESLSLLYVAMTRAKYALYMFVDGSGDPNRQTLAGVVQSALRMIPIGDASQVGSPAGAPAPHSVLFCHGDANWFCKVRPQAAAVEHREALIHRVELRSRAQAGAAAVAPPAPATAASRLTSDLFRLPNSQATDRGMALHAMFQTIRWIEDFQPIDDDLLRIARAVAPRRSNQWRRETVDLFLKVIRNPQVRACLSRPHGCDGDLLTVYCEHPFVKQTSADAGIQWRSGGATIQTGYIDRLVVHHAADGSIQSATIFDFKTDALGDVNGPTSAERYRPQLEAYRAAVAQMFAIDPLNVNARVIFVQSGVVVEM
jgi:ATP-dependent helicase/nuclease subunit A